MLMPFVAVDALVLPSGIIVMEDVVFAERLANLLLFQKEEL